MTGALAILSAAVVVFTGFAVISCAVLAGLADQLIPHGPFNSEFEEA
jgi:hypothetical protein